MPTTNQGGGERGGEQRNAGLNPEMTFVRISLAQKGLVAAGSPQREMLILLLLLLFLLFLRGTRDKLQLSW